MKIEKTCISIGTMAIVAVAIVAVAAQPDHSYFNVSGGSQAEWSFHFSYGNCPGGHLTVWGTHNCSRIGNPIFQESITACKKYKGIVPSTINDVIINDIFFEFRWDYWCGNVDYIKFVMPGWNGNIWVLEPIAPWINANVDGAVPIPSIGDPTGEIQEVYVVVDLGEFLRNPIELQDTYQIIEGRCDALPGYLIGTTLPEFDPNAGPYESPFSTTPLTGVLYRDGEVEVAQECVITGCDPPTFENIMVFPTPERFLGSDLNSDGDIDDTILRYQNLKTNQVVNTGLTASGAYHAIDIYENIIAFVGEDSHICCYDTNTGTLRRIGVAGSHLSIYKNIIAFSSEGTVHYFDLDTQALVDTGVTGYSPVIYENIIVFCAPAPKHTIWIYDLCTGQPVNTGAIGKNPTIYGNIIAFETLEFSIAEDLNGDGDTYDMVIRFYDLETRTITNTGAVGLYPAINGSRIVFATPENDIYQDLNGDDKILGEIIRYYDLETGCLINTGTLGTQPSIYGNTITFFLWEKWVGRDLNGDRDQSDPIVRTYSIAGAEMVAVGQGAWPFKILVVI